MKTQRELSFEKDTGIQGLIPKEDLMRLLETIRFTQETNQVIDYIAIPAPKVSIYGHKIVFCDVDRPLIKIKEKQCPA